MVFNKTPHEILSAVQFRCSNNMTSSSTGVFIIIVIAVLSCTVITLIRLLTFFTLLGLVTSNRQRNAKQFSTEFGRNLESKAPDPNVCIVKLCSLHLHRPQGPTFNLGFGLVWFGFLTALQHKKKDISDTSMVKLCLMIQSKDS
jgi:hypothetical protein